MIFQSILELFINFSDKSSDSTKENSNNEGNLQCIAILPGIGVYTDSSDSDCTNSSDDESSMHHHHHARDLTGRVVKPQGGQAECC